MQHLNNLIKFIFLYILLSIPLQILSFIIIPIALLLPKPIFIPLSESPHIPNHRLLKIFWLWDNSWNGIDGDDGWNNKGFNTSTYWSRLKWLTRNRCSNFEFWIGVHTTITKLTGYGAKWHDVGFGYHNAYSKTGKRYFEYIIGVPYYKRKDGTYRGLIGSIGYKNLNVTVNELPKYYSYSFSLDIQSFRVLNKK